MFYTGIGRRKTPFEVCSLMSELSEYLANCGYVLRSGGADGADKAFQSGVEGAKGYLGKNKMEIFLPWSGFNKFRNDPEKGFISVNLLNNYNEAIEIAKELHPVWLKLSNDVKALHTRNVYQILGLDLNTPSKKVFFWAEPTKSEAGVKGGTATAVLLAKRLGIKTSNLWYPEVREDIIKKLKNRG